MAKEDVEYELFVKEIYESLIKEDDKDLKNVNIQHNVLIEGISGFKHQIDIYWEFEKAGDVYKVAIECKNYNNNVSIGKIRDFNSVLDDIKNIKGIVVSKKGFQSGAKTFADKYGIALKVISKPEDFNWKGYIKTIVLTIVAYMKTNLKKNIIFDIEWIKENYKNKEIFKIADLENNIFIFDENTREKISLYELINSLECNKEGKKFYEKFEYENSYLINNDIKLKLKSIDFTYDVKAIENSLEIDGTKDIKAIVKNVKDGKIKSIKNY